MEAPEKIYLTTFGYPICEPFPQEGSNPDTVWSTKPYSDTDSIEYTRTDAFIEKADKFISSFFHPDDTELKKSILDEFHKYMKGE